MVGWWLLLREGVSVQRCQVAGILYSGILQTQRPADGIGSRWTKRLYAI